MTILRLLHGCIRFYLRPRRRPNHRRRPTGRNLGHCPTWTPILRPPLPPKADDPPLFDWLPQPDAPDCLPGVVLPTASGVLIRIAISRGILVAICGLTYCAAVVPARCAVSRRTVRSFNRSGGPLSGCLVLRIGSVAIF